MEYCFLLGQQKSELKLVGYADSDYSGDLVERNSSSGCVFLLNKDHVSWCSKKQSMVALSSCEAEYISGSLATCQGVWLGELLKELNIPIKAPIELRNDYVSAINLSKNLESHGRSKQTTHRSEISLLERHGE